MARTADQGIAAYATCLPRHRLRWADLTAALGQPSGTGVRVVAGFDEDSTTMAVEAARVGSGSRRPGSVWFATTSPAYREKANATAVHAALDLGADGLAIEFAERGTAWKEVLTGTVDPDGALPVNPDGGLKSFGHPVGASGLRMLFECWLQFRGEAGERQLAAPTLGLTHNLGGRPGACVSFVSVVGAGRD
jgi:acetyl-CoA acetyltransferase